MGEYADMAIEGDWALAEGAYSTDDPDMWDGDPFGGLEARAMRRAKSKTCRRCGLGGLVWGQVEVDDGMDLAWRLHTRAGALHSCAAPEPQGDVG